MVVENLDLLVCPTYERFKNNIHLLFFVLNALFSLVMMAHGHVNIKCAPYGLEFYPSDANLTMRSLSKLMRDLCKPPTTSSRALFKGGGTPLLYEAVGDENEVCSTSLAEPINKVV